MGDGRNDQTLSKHAVVVDPCDNVAVIKFGLSAGTDITLDDGKVITIAGEPTAGHRFATTEIAEGQFVRQYGQPIGTSRGIAAGEVVTSANMSNDIPVVRKLPADLHTPAPDYLPEDEVPTFAGFRRSDGTVGTRNHILIVPTSMCASHESLQISILAEHTLYDRERFPNVDGVVAIPHNKGCGCSDGSNIDITLRTLANYAAHPNVGAVVMIELGCEKTNLSKMEDYLTRRGSEGFGKPVSWLGVQSEGGTAAVVKRGLEEVERMLPIVNETVRKPLPASEIVLGLECGGSDGFSGLSANPALGRAADWVVRSGGTVILSEVPEFCGAEHVLAHRSCDVETGRAVYALVDWYKEYASKFGTYLGENPSPGNVDGGLLNITIKSLGAIAKGGTTRVEGTCEYSEPPTGRGLQLMQGPGYDQESVPGLVAAGSNVVVFTTGRGTTIGNAICPVIKLASNTPVFERMPHDIDLNAGSIIDGTETIPEVGQRIFERIVEVAGGTTLAHAEVHKHREFQIWAEQSVSL
ncbi:MAG TPA: altronate dehydratase [Planctomycetes bacterium]|nr:altronate dehydratase [Planctomycetota bacterium]HIK82997.1 altronate dehydratase [Planctomycetota bacterium]